MVQFYELLDVQSTFLTASARSDILGIGQTLANLYMQLSIWSYNKRLKLWKLSPKLQWGTRVNETNHIRRGFWATRFQAAVNLYAEGTARPSVKFGAIGHFSARFVIFRLGHPLSGCAPSVALALPTAILRGPIVGQTRVGEPLNLPTNPIWIISEGTVAQSQFFSILHLVRSACVWRTFASMSYTPLIWESTLI